MLHYLRKCVGATQRLFAYSYFSLTTHPLSNSPVICRGIRNFYGIGKYTKGNYTKPLETTFVRCLATEESVVAQQHNPDLNLKDIALNTNEDRWHEHPEPIKIDATFIDTHYNASVTEQQAVRTILGIHDMPGDHKDLFPVLEPFAQAGYRVVILNLPGNDYTRIKARKERVFFTYSTEEVTELLIRFLSDLDILNIDLAIAHGTGTGPLTMLMASTEIMKSALFICPTPALQFSEAFGNRKNISRILSLHDRPLFRLPMRLLLQSLCKKNDVTISLNKVVPFMRTMFGFGYGYLPGLARTTSYKKTPLSYIVAGKDGQYKLEDALEYAEIFGIQVDKFIEYSNDNPVDLSTLAQRYRKQLKLGIQLKTSNHNPLLNDYYRDVIIAESARLLREVKR